MSELMKRMQDVLLGESDNSQDIMNGVGVGLSTKICKINYNSTPNVPVGVWIVGQKKESDGIISEPGSIVGKTGKEIVRVENKDVEVFLQKNAIIPLVIRQRYNLFSPKKPEIACSSPLFRNYTEEVYGNKHGYRCGKDCPYRDKNLPIRCKIEFVLFGLAKTIGGEEIPCNIYAKGINYISFDNWMKTSTTAKLVKDGRVIEKSVRLCSHYLTLGTSPKRDGINEYYQGYFFKGDMVDNVEDYQRYSKLADDIVEFINSQKTTTETPPAISEDDDIPF